MARTATIRHTCGGKGEAMNELTLPGKSDVAVFDPQKTNRSSCYDAEATLCESRDRREP